MIVETRRSLSRPERRSGVLSIHLLGEIRLRRGDLPIALPASKRTRALLGFLVATSTPQPRQTLCDLLWDGPDDPRAALRWSLTKLRPLVDGADAERLEADRERVAFRSGGASVDVHRLGELLREPPGGLTLPQLEEAAALLHGEFLDGLDLPSCYRFHHWCLGERERWGGLRRKVLAQLVARLADDPPRALPYARAMVAADPLSEAAHGRLVDLLGAVGRRKDAQEHYAYARDLLRREMDAPLTGDLRAPSAARGEPGPTTANASAPARALEPGLVGRTREQQAIGAALDSLVAGSTPQGLIFLGEPGIGKSRLLDLIARTGERKGARIVAARCFEAEAVRPYGCWADALAPLIVTLDDPAMRRDLAFFIPSHETPSKDDKSRTHLFGAVQTLLAGHARRCPLVVMIDDLQWIDEGSSSLLHYLLRDSGRSAGFLFGGAARTDEIDDNPWCKKLIGALAQNGQISRMPLAPLGASDAAQMLGSAADSAEVAAAIKESGGNPLFLTELAHAGQYGHSIAGYDLAGLIGDRVARLGAAEAELIVFASTTTRAFRPEMLAAAMELPEPQLAERLARLERRGLLRPGPDGQFDFAHDLIRQITYRSLSQPRRRLIHRQIARALEVAVKSDQNVAGELAYHAGAAGDHLLAVHACIAAGEHCLRVFANAGAIDAADRGLGHLAYCAPGPERAHCQIALLGVKVFAGASPGARAMPKILGELHRAVEEAELMGLRDDAAHCWHMISWTTQQSNDTDSSHSAILRAEFISRAADDVTRCQHLANAGRCMLEGEADNVARARSFLNDADLLAIKLKQTMVEIEWGKGLLARWDGDLTQAHSLMLRALKLARLREDRWREMECLVWIAKIAIERGAYDQVEALCDEIDGVAARIGESRAPVADALRAMVAFAVAPTPGPSLKPSLAALRDYDDKAQLAYVLNQIASLELDRGFPDAAFAATKEALGAAQAVKLGTEIIVAKSILARAQVLLGDAAGAAALMAQAMRGAGLAPFSARARENLDRASTLLRDSNAGSNGEGAEESRLRAIT